MNDPGRRLAFVVSFYDNYLYIDGKYGGIGHDAALAMMLVPQDAARLAARGDGSS